MTQGSEVPPYPFSSPEQAVELFVTGSPDANAWRAKLALLVYACADAGYDIDADALRSASGWPLPGDGGVSWLLNYLTK